MREKFSKLTIQMYSQSEDSLIRINGLKQIVSNANCRIKLELDREGYHNPKFVDSRNQE